MSAYCGKYHGWYFMSSSSYSSIDNTKFEHVSCRDCGRRTLVCVSRMSKNPGRRYYGCAQHGWQKWVVADTLSDEDSSERCRRRLGSERFASRGHILGNWNVPPVVWILVIVNLTLLAVYLITLLVRSC